MVTNLLLIILGVLIGGVISLIYITVEIDKALEKIVKNLEDKKEGN